MYDYSVIFSDLISLLIFNILNVQTDFTHNDIYNYKYGLDFKTYWFLISFIMYICVTIDYGLFIIILYSTHFFIYNIYI